jgi:hypothetical protein
MATQTNNLMTTGRIAREAGIPYDAIIRIVNQMAITPAMTMDGTRLFDDAAVAQIVRAYGRIILKQKLQTVPTCTKE